MAAKSLIFLGLVFAIILVVSSHVVSARNDPGLPQTEGDVQVDGWHDHHHHYHHHCHYPHCQELEADGDHTEAQSHEEAGKKAAKSSDGAEVDGHYKHKPKKCKHWPHC
ncbi:endoribonuclease YSH1-like [Sesamum indicum]|uniref:Endoribonuclease YSH1-like n=1 Tax=Sesamum indicum TaxID=4182 RepID=A0A6I9USP9_SESIN|nr:endoribonuclease YSH1-like [Sesamum indicum]